MRGLDPLGHGESGIDGNRETSVVQAAPRPGHVDPDGLADRFTRGLPVSSPTATRAVDTSRPVSRWPPAASTPVPLVRFPMSRVKVLVSPALPTAVTAAPRLR
jgi:hypothetical protein